MDGADVGLFHLESALPAKQVPSWNSFMTLAESVRDSARTLYSVSSGLAAALRLAAKRPRAPANVVETFHEAEALSLTVDAVLDKAAPMLALVSGTDCVVGRAPLLGAENARVRNGFDSLGQILLVLLGKATDAVSDVAANQSQWLLSPLQAKQCLEAMTIHHGQLKAIYGILHLASMIIAEVDVRKTLFLDVMGDEPRPELEPRLWRSAINTDPLFGRFFGFHYAPEMRSFLSVVNIARGSISSAAASTADKSSPIIRNIAALGWGWVYSNMVILNNLGVTIDGVSQIGSDRSHAPHGIEQVRMFMNLAEDPFVSGVAALASADVAIDHVFSIFGDRDQGKEIGGVSALETRRVPIPVSPMPARVISYPGRPLARSALKIASSISHRPAARTAELEALVDETAEVSATGGSAPVVRNGPDNSEESAVDFAHVPRDAGSKGPLESLSGVVKQMQNQIGAAAARIMESPRPQPTSAPAGTAAVDRPEPAAARSISDLADTSVLASAIKNEFTRLHTNVSSFLGPHRGEPAPGLILHFHGGGFVSQSSAGHSIYLKEWAADLPDAVILSVDYRLAPENPYPCALEDCLFAYQWALENATLIGTKAERVVLCGDSAGGNLAVAVALKAQAYGLRPADGICLAYPALYVNVAWSPSRLLSFFDPLLPLSILDLCLRAYVPEGERSHDNPFISPLIASPDALRALPPVALITGSLDPLLDDAVQFAHNLRQCGRDGDTLHVVESLPHGFLNLVQVSRQARDASCLLSSRMAGMLGIKQRAGRGLATTDSDGGPAEGAAVAGGSSAEDTVAATLPAAALFDT